MIICVISKFVVNLQKKIIEEGVPGEGVGHQVIKKNEDERDFKKASKLHGT